MNKLIDVIQHLLIKVILCWDATENKVKILSNNKILLGKVAENSLLWSITFLSIEDFSLTPLFSSLILKFLASFFFNQSKVLFHFKNLL